ncbi:hypothetical protein PR202_gb11452 [Eleusine coracana subsp. coracana]|uniref:Chalcone synthase n=1 Tax=Eleusine coracana subsp. coracana TaxID=191504 RepID=A0AAV5EK94_ELECO|nr:hypothetical protein PR202_gb11452 [Eleusine coracana subsp. coracana]
MSLLVGSQLPVHAAATLRGHGFGRVHRPDGPASVLGIGTANPVNCVRQEDYADYYFRVTRSEHLTDLKAKMKRICHKSAIKKRYFHHNEELLGAHPEFLDRAAPSLDSRLGILATAVPELTAAAATKAIAEWGRPAADITHLVMAAYSGSHMLAAPPRCASPRTSPRTPAARVLVACAELTLTMLRAPHAADAGTLVMQSMFGDGAGAVIVGADPDGSDYDERPVFEMVSASQTVIPETETEHPAAGRLREDGLRFHPSKEMPSLVRDNIERCVKRPVLGGARHFLGRLFVLMELERPVLGGAPRRPRGLGRRRGGARVGALAASRRVLSEYGNLSGPAVIFVLDELQRRAVDSEMGVMLGLGPGVSVETMVLRSSTGRHVKN